MDTDSTNNCKLQNHRHVIFRQQQPNGLPPTCLHMPRGADNCDSPPPNYQNSNEAMPRSSAGIRLTKASHPYGAACTRQRSHAADIRRDNLPSVPYGGNGAATLHTHTQTLLMPNGPKPKKTAKIQIRGLTMTQTQRTELRRKGQLRTQTRLHLPLQPARQHV